ncbi:hypothetical protein SDC9_49291 [bioreactor metagenome]|uniref:DUF4393 domain-containing protein n=1 Tax=bioreactor metagenome TaxID=1076179 RepID=A0A644WGY3_9ZZZZ
MPDEIEKTLVEAAEKVLDAPAKEAGEQLAKLINLIFTPLEILKINRDAWLNDYRDRISQKYNKIPQEKLVLPPLNIIGPALEASKYHIGSKELREMFANLIAHACNADMKSLIHPAYISILTQLSPLEAQILAGFRPKTEIKMGLTITSKTGDHEEILSNQEPSGVGTFTFPEIVLPIANYYLCKGTQEMLAQDNVIKFDECTDFGLISSSVANLCRLGLLQISFEGRVSNGDYDFFRNNMLYRQLEQDISNKESLSIRLIRGHIVGDYDRITIKEGIVRLTQFGYNFISSCVIESEVTQE